MIRPATRERWTPADEAADQKKRKRVDRNAPATQDRDPRQLDLFANEPDQA